mgnify:FL=1
MAVLENLRFYNISARKAAVSDILVENPHSLSYQARTRTRPPSSTCVWFRSKVELFELWLKSIDTSGSSFIPSMPVSGPLLAASIIAEFISSTLVGRLGMNFKSIKLTLDVGTRSSTVQFAS